MRTPTQQQILSAFRGATKGEIAKISFDKEFDDVDFDKIEFYGWRDRKIPRRAYLVIEHDGELVSLLLNRSEAKPRRRAMCSWCRDVELVQDVMLYAARRAGPRGRRGDTIAALICEDFACPKRARKLPPAYHKDTDLDAIRAGQVDEMSRRVHAFVTEALSTDG
ncbi:FBP domain-containing protein [Gordonia sp. HY285]|uniref:FBP domain-containing protein n=1 Tax=Gordonia liuliyuniae TaxID=2911517 RepID=UPI001F1DAAB6|nr:FBP domain-containing protein [Gordonia liuliyuniae]MCF8611356.1 FBP domain-containing protein [Gordonia liuliyuniae]